MSTGPGKHPAPSRDKARYARRESRIVPDRASSRPSGAATAGAPDPAGPRASGLAAGRASDPAGPRASGLATGRASSPAVGLFAGAMGPPIVGSGSRGGDHQARQAAGRLGEPAAPVPTRPRAGLFAWRRANRRITVQSHSPAVWLGERLAALGRRLLIVGKILAALAALVAAVAGTRLAARHVVASPRFALREVRVGPTVHVTRDEILDRSSVVLGDRLLALDTDVIAARLARHPWIASARVQRELPATLVIDVTERQAAAVAVIGGLYLVDEQGHPFKHATLEESDGRLVLTGISRTEYARLPRASEAAFREALALFSEYQHRDSLAAARHGGASSTRPALSEIHIDPHVGFSLFLYDGGTEIRLGRGQTADKLARLDEILAEFGSRRASALRVVHLDGPASDRVPIGLVSTSRDAPSEPPASTAQPKARKSLSGTTRTTR